MASELPSDFEKPWDLSDVVLHTNNSDGKDIHAYKGALAMFSPYFRALFFGNFKEKNGTSADVYCDHDVMVEILRNIHQIGYKYDGGQKEYTPEMLVKMYRVADQYDFAFIRRLCEQQLEGFPSVQMANAAVRIRRYDILMKILSKWEKKKVKEFIHQDEDDESFPGYDLNKEEFLTFFEKVVGKPLPKPTETSDTKPKGPLNLEEITEDLEDPRLDLTKPFAAADLMIIANNALGRVLYANKSVVDLMSPKFAKYISPNDELLLEGPKRLVARVKVEYTTMKEILSIFHVCKTDFSKPDRVLHPVLLYSMYCAAKKDELDIPSVRSLCVAKLKEHKSIDAVDVLCSLNLNFPMCDTMDELKAPQMRDWVYREDGHLSYRNGTEVVSVTPSQMDRIFYRNLTCSLIGDFKKEFFRVKN